MWRNAFRVAPLLIVGLSLCSAASLARGEVLTDIDAAPLPCSSSTFRFSKEEPLFEMAQSPTARVSDCCGTSSCCDTGSASCDCRCGSGCCERLFGFVAGSDSCFNDFISPVTNPVFFEDPRTLTEARFLMLHHRIPTDALGGHANVVGVQVRAALSDRVSVIANKSGFITSTNPLVEDGWADISVGLKYNLFSNPQAQRLLSVGASYELTTGSERALQGNGSGVFDLFVTGGMALGEWQAVSASGLLLPADRTAESSLWFWSNHLSRRIGCSNFYMLGEVNWFHYLGAGQTPLPLPIEGGDLFNFGTYNVAGNDIVTGAIGFRYKPSDHLILGLAWEAPLTERRDILDNRMTFDCILRY